MLMNVFSGARDLLLVVILGQVIAWGFFAFLDPVGFGRWLQQIDTGRYEHIDCDCTDPLE
jgi:hypothetical protein